MKTARITAFGWLVLLAACSLPNVGLWGNARADVGLYGLYGGRIAHGNFPYRPGFAMEFPPGAIPPLAVPALPRSHYVAFFHGFAFLCALAAVAAVAVATKRILPTLVAAVAPVALGQITLNSLDFWPAALAAWAVVLVLRDRPRWGLALLGVATSAKLYPALLAPALLLYVARNRGRREAERALFTGAAVTAAIFLPFAAIAPGGLEFSLREQVSRGLQVESLGGSILGVAHRLGADFHVVVSSQPYSFNIAGGVADALATVLSLVTVAAAAVAWSWLRRGEVDRSRTARTVATTAVAFVAFVKVLSPQYLLFLVPLVPLVDSLLAWGVFLLALGLTQIWARFPVQFNHVTHLAPIIWVVLARNLVLVALYLLLLRGLRRRETSQA